MKSGNYLPLRTTLFPQSAFSSQPNKSSGHPQSVPTFYSSRTSFQQNDSLHLYSRKKRSNKQMGKDNFKPFHQYPRREYLDPAPRLQFIKYLDSTENVFYENRRNARTLKIIDDAKPLLIFSFLFLLLTYYLLSLVNPYDGVCPHNAECGVYIHCHPGYQLSPTNLCEISEETKMERSAICSLLIENLKVKYGTNECENRDDIPSVKLNQIFEQFQVQNSALRSQIKNWLVNTTNQEQNKFNYQNGAIIPQQKVYPFLCRMSLMVNSPQFQVFLLAAFSVLTVGGIILHEVRYGLKVKKIYNDLRRKVEAEGDIVIDRDELRKKYGRLDEKLWGEVDLARSKDKKIVYYQAEFLHWKLLS